VNKRIAKKVAARGGLKHYPPKRRRYFNLNDSSVRKLFKMRYCPTVQQRTGFHLSAVPDRLSIVLAANNWTTKLVKPSFDFVGSEITELSYE
jgi:hypothetical protein